MRPRFFWLTASFLWLCVTGFAQNISYRFATQAEAQMLITDIDPFTNGWNRFDIEARLQKKGGKKSPEPPITGARGIFLSFMLYFHCRTMRFWLLPPVS